MAYGGEFRYAPQPNIDAYWDSDTTWHEQITGVAAFWSPGEPDFWDRT